MITQEVLDRWLFTHYADTPETALMREVYSGMYVSWDWKDRTFRLMPDHRRGFPGIVLPHIEMGQIIVMVASMGGDWCNGGTD